MATLNTSALSGHLSQRRAEPWRWVGPTGPGEQSPPPDDAWMTVTPPQRFATFGGIATALRPLVEATIDRAPWLVEEHRAALTAVLPEVFGGDTAHRGLAAGADAITFAIVRRISRESLHTSTIVDGVARFLLALMREAVTERPAWLLVNHAERMDRPSLRVLYRLWCLGASGDDLRFRVSASHPRHAAAVDPVDDAFGRRLAVARGALLARLQCLTTGDVVRNAGVVLDGPPPCGGDIAMALTESAHGLVNQNYESAYLWAWAAAASSPNDHQRSQIWRMTALADANLGQYGAARAAIRSAAANASDPRYRAHLDYLDGLLSTKRFYELDEADAAFDRGLAVLDGTAAEAPSRGPGEDESAPGTGARRAALERAWLINGKALVATLRARSVEDADERQRRLDDVLRVELDALSLVTDSTDADEVYLRFNLLANVAFLLEIGGRFAEAVRFWERAFGQFLTLADRDAFEQTFGYRVGLLRAKAGDLDSAVEALRRALSLAEGRSDHFSAERIAGGLAYAVLLRDGHVAAAGAYEQAAVRALDNADMLSAADHLAALLVCCVETGAHHGVEGIVAFLRDLDLDHHAVSVATAVDPRDVWPGLVDAVHDGRLSVRPPPPKLPAYVPLIDLEPVPDEDLNRYLAGTATVSRSLNGPAAKEDHGG